MNGPFPISMVMSVLVIPRTLDGPVYPFFSREIRTSLPKFKTNISVYIVFEPLQTLSVSCTPYLVFNLRNSLIVLAMELGCCCYKDKSGECIIMRG